MSAKPVILIVDDERNTRDGLARALRGDHEILLAENAQVGLELLKKHAVDLVLTDLRMPGQDGMAFIQAIQTLADPPLVIMLTAYGTIQTAVDAMRHGAYDYLAKPVDLDNLEMVVRRGLESRRLRAENEALRRQLDPRFGMEGIIGNSPAMNSVFEMVRQVAPARSTVMLTGESGTGKERIANVIHRLSPRAAKPFVVVHCASLNPNLLESELFGHEKGSFTGAHERTLGRFERADGGTLFLDEIGEIDASTQIKLLRVLENRNVERVGGAATVEIDVRLIAATNKDLKALVDAGRFREDLYYRLNVVCIELPPLRRRLEDVPLLLTHFLKEFTRENSKTLNGFTPEALKVLTAYAWPGNVRELRNTVERMVVMARGTSLTLGDVPPEVRAGVSAALEPKAVAAAAAAGAESPTLDLASQERSLIVRALQECQGNRSLAARRLGIGRRTLYRKLDEYGIKEDG